MRCVWTSLLSVLIFATQAAAHDLYLKLDSFFVKPNEKLVVKVLNGDFMKSESPVDFARLNDASVIWPDGRVSRPVAADFGVAENMSVWNLTTGGEGTFIVGISTKKREIGLSNEDFDAYLAEDGIPDILAARKKQKPSKPSVSEMYSKHVKIIFQAGDARTDSYKRNLGYPVEIIPQTNPYALQVGETFEFLCLRDGKPIANQYVMSGRDHNGRLIIGKNVRTNSRGIGRIKIDGPGKWYVKFINMVRVDKDLLDYESNWTTLTFAVR